MFTFQYKHPIYSKKAQAILNAVIAHMSGNFWLQEMRPAARRDAVGKIYFEAVSNAPAFRKLTATIGATLMRLAAVDFKFGATEIELSDGTLVRRLDLDLLGRLMRYGENAITKKLYAQQAIDEMIGHAVNPFVMARREAAIAAIEQAEDDKLYKLDAFLKKWQARLRTELLNADNTDEDAKSALLKQLLEQRANEFGSLRDELDKKIEDMKQALENI